MRRLSFLLVASLSLAACSMTLPVEGQIQDSPETFTGTATGYIDHSGDLKVVTTKGATCTGTFVYVTERTGQGVFHCTDGRSGPFEFVSTGNHGSGYGTLGKEKFTFTFG